MTTGHSRQTVEATGKSLGAGSLTRPWIAFQRAVPGYPQPGTTPNQTVTSSCPLSHASPQARTICHYHRRRTTMLTRARTILTCAAAAAAAGLAASIAAPALATTPVEHGGRAPALARTQTGGRTQARTGCFRSWLQ
jgi:hypothetical protein